MKSYIKPEMDVTEVTVQSIIATSVYINSVNGNGSKVNIDYGGVADETFDPSAKKRGASYDEDDDLDWEN